LGQGEGGGVVFVYAQGAIDKLFLLSFRRTVRPELVEGWAKPANFSM
jgi:hypothetical protein